MVSLKVKENQYKHKSSFLQKNIAAFRFPIFRLLCIRWLVHIHNVIRIKIILIFDFCGLLWTFQDPTWSINSLLRISTTTIKLEWTKGGGGWGGLFWPKTLGYIWSIFIKHIYSTEWLTLVDIPEILAFKRCMTWLYHSTLWCWKLT